MNTVFYIGFDKTDITPSAPCRMAGYSREGLSTSVLDPIQINSCSFRMNGETFILTVLDSIMLEGEFCDRVKAGVTEATGVAADHIVVACIHTHSAPAFFKLAFEDTVVEPALRAEALARMTQSAVAAHARMVPATCTFESMEVEGLYGNRNVKGGVEDKHCHLLSFTGEDGRLVGAVFNISAHPTILNGSSTALSADLIGQVRLRLERELGCGVLCTNGTCGDVSTRFYRKASGMEELMGTADALFSQFMEKRQAAPLTALEHPLSGRVEHPATFDAATDPDWQEMTARLQAELDADANSPMARFLMDRQELKARTSPIHLNLISQFYVFGSLIVVALPGDICSELGRRVKAAFPGRQVVIIGYANTYCNYLVPDCDYGKYFETYNSRLARGEADAFIAQVIGSIESLIAE